MDWDDLRIFLQLARDRQMSRAGKALGVDDTTVARRVARLEATLGVALVQRAGRRTVLTAQGEALALAAEEMESVALRKISGLGEDRQSVAGRVRVGAPEGLGVGWVARQLARLSAAHDGLETELVALPRTYSLARREVDIAITLDRPAVGQVSVQKLTDYSLDLYGTATYLDRHGTPAARAGLSGHRFAGYIPELLFTDELDFARAEAGLPELPVIRSTSVLAQVNAVASGAALGVLPTYLAAAHPELVRVLPEAFRFIRSYWVSVHDDLRHLHRVRVVQAALIRQVRADRALFIRG